MMCDKALNHSEVSLEEEVSLAERRGFSKSIEDREHWRKEDHFPTSSEAELSEGSEIKLRIDSSSYNLSRSIWHPSNKPLSSRESTPCDESSGALDARWIDGENEKKISSKYEKKIYKMRSKHQQKFELKKGDVVFQVTGKGTKLMKSLNFPTLIVKCLTGKLDKSRVYFVVMEVGPELKSEMPALMFSSPYAHKKTRFAELLPFGLVEGSKSVCLTPILQRKRCRRVFHRGFSFNIKSLIPGRTIDGSGENPWNRYDLSKVNMQNMPKEIIDLDIKQMSLLTFNKILPVKHKNKRVRRSKTKALGGTPSKVKSEKKESPSGKVDSTNLRFRTNCDQPVLGRRRGCTVSNSVKSMQPTHMDKDLSVSIGTASQVDSITYLDELDKFWCVSDLT